MDAKLKSVTKTEWKWDADMETWSSNTRTGRDVTVFETGGKWKVQMSGWPIEGISTLNKMNRDEVIETVRAIFNHG